MKLAVFDLDQTLVDVLPVHNETMCRIFQRFFRVDARFTEVDYTGRSLAENMLALVNLKGTSVDTARDRLKDMLDAYDSIFAEVMPGDGRKYILPGVIALLEGLRKADAVLVLYTGDSRAVAESICRAAGLTGYFRRSFYGTEVAARADMVRQAIEWAERETGRKFRGKDTVITGDSLRDIECGKQFNAVTIAVATGSHTAAELQAAQPDFLFTDLADTEKVLRAVLGRGRAISRPSRTA